jgi:hypothetical protein
MLAGSTVVLALVMVAATFLVKKDSSLMYCDTGLTAGTQSASPVEEREASRADQAVMKRGFPAYYYLDCPQVSNDVNSTDAQSDQGFRWKGVVLDFLAWLPVSFALSFGIMKLGGRRV